MKYIIIKAISEIILLHTALPRARNASFIMTLLSTASLNAGETDQLQKTIEILKNTSERSREWVQKTQPTVQHPKRGFWPDWDWAEPETIAKEQTILEEQKEMPAALPQQNHPLLSQYQPRYSAQITPLSIASRSAIHSSSEIKSILMRFIAACCRRETHSSIDN